MAFSHTNSKGQVYYLHQKDVELKGGRMQRIHFFAKDVRPSKGTPIDAVPDGHVIVENPRTGLPVLKRG
jgi:hypothetical protein